MNFQTINPATGQSIEAYAYYTQDRVLDIVSDAARHQSTWSRSPLSTRCELVRQVGQQLNDQREALAMLMTAEMGKPISESLAEVDKCVLLCNYYASHSSEALQDRMVGEAMITYQPLGVILGIMPWNFPAWQACRFILPAILSGNAVLLKHAEQVTGSALLLEQVLHAAGVSEHLVRVILCDNDQVSALIADARIAGVSLTGSTRAGKAVAAQAGTHLKPCVLELGGSDPYLVLADADIDHAVSMCFEGRRKNAGQSCISPKRLIVHQDVYDVFIDKLHPLVSSLSYGDPSSPDTLMGPISRTALRDTLHDQVDRSIQSGARCLAGGKIPNHLGAYYPPTLLVDVQPGMAAFDEEIFGPVWCVVRADSESHAVQLANQTNYGLGGGIFSQDIDRAQHIAKHLIHTGNCFVNGYVSSDPRLPFGGIKQSGYGRELGPEGLLAFVNVKVIG